jgi:hypothetical protein
MLDDKKIIGIVTKLYNPKPFKVSWFLYGLADMMVLKLVNKSNCLGIVLFQNNLYTFI